MGNRYRLGVYTPAVAVTDVTTAFAYSSSASTAYTKYSAPGSSPSSSNGDAGFTPASCRLMFPVPFPASLSCVKKKRCLSAGPGGSVNEQVIPPAVAPACALKEAKGSSPRGLKSSSASPAMILVTFAPMKALRTSACLGVLPREYVTYCRT